jgi:peptidyl-tRNA hydrolase, PTH1 family
MAVRLIIGLGNPGIEYQMTRHNAGAWLVQALAEKYSVELKFKTKFKGSFAQIKIESQELMLLIPTTFMNLSGDSVLAVINFYQIKPEEILVCHDDLDFPPGLARIKKGGGDGGHNGLKDIIKKIKSRDFYRLRIGIGRPRLEKEVVDFVLYRPTISQRKEINLAIAQAIEVIPDLISGQVEKAMQTLHSE